MAISQTITLLILALAIASFVAFLSPTARLYLTGRAAWLAILLGGLTLSAASWFVAEEGIRGTLLQRSHGWPKPYSGECLSPECTEGGPGINLLYFLGNSFVYVAGLLLFWTLIALLLALFAKRRNAPAP